MPIWQRIATPGDDEEAFPYVDDSSPVELEAAVKALRSAVRSGAFGQAIRSDGQLLEAVERAVADARVREVEEMHRGVPAEKEYNEEIVNLWKTLRIQCMGGHSDSQHSPHYTLDFSFGEGDATVSCRFAGDDEAAVLKYIWRDSEGHAQRESIGDATNRELWLNFRTSLGMTDACPVGQLAFLTCRLTENQFNAAALECPSWADDDLPDL
eukprot:TRINITY_DN92021_c0_g1_i1.p1 TRINITY_DN92021_c0_g1~~TRINITY_DN92021_c0_g1_i1.p1  ORF type:complete len:211 (+),score=40.06 TRINITY_DN92021_c0_g1_i1:68-700(+)